jgi:hypothetical protein
MSVSGAVAYRTLLLPDGLGCLRRLRVVALEPHVDVAMTG